MLLTKSIQVLKLDDILKLTLNYDDKKVVSDVNIWYKKHTGYDEAMRKATIFLAIKINKGKIPNFKYLEKTLASLIAHNRKTAAKVVDYINQYRDFKSNKAINKPEWLDEYIKEIEEMN